MSIFDEVREKRKALADTLMDEDNGIRGLLEELYPDNAHFIYELLQNAEDTGASEVSFILEKERLIFEHNGEPFSDDDIWGITNVGMGTKKNSDDKIGKFGIGFKSVFAYTESPLVFSRTNSFQVTDLVLPSELPINLELGDKTRFEFPFNNKEKNEAVAFEEIKVGLCELSEKVLLFLTSIESVSWSLAGGISGEILRETHAVNHIEILKISDTNNTESFHYLHFNEPVLGLDSQNVAIAFELEFLPKINNFQANKLLSEQLRIIPANPGCVAVFFPAAKETSRLRFHLHAPFIPEISRASLKETSANSPLFDQLAKLTVSTLYKIRDLGLLTVDFLNVLPNKQDNIPSNYQCIMDGIFHEMNGQELTPTYSKMHAPACQLAQGKASLKRLLTDEDLNFLISSSFLFRSKVTHKPVMWGMASNLRNNNADRFLSELSFLKFDVEDFIVMFPSDYSRDDEPFNDWMSKKSIEWHQKFYAFLNKEDAADSLFYPRIIRLSDGHYSTAEDCFFSEDERVTEDEQLKYVSYGVYTSGGSKRKTEQEQAKEFLTKIGVKEIGETERLKRILESRYKKADNIIPKKAYLRDLKRFIIFIKNNPYDSNIFEEYYILYITRPSPFLNINGDEDVRVKPCDVYLDTPFLTTRLKAFYSNLEFAIYPLSLSLYEDRQNDDEFINFVKKVGVRTLLEIKKVDTRFNRKADYLRNSYARYSDYSVDEDYIIDGLEGLITSQSFDLSRLIWDTLSSKGILTRASRRNNKSERSRVAPSQLAVLLTEKAWVPQRNKEFVVPSKASEALLPKDFKFDPNWPWLGTIKFGTDEDKLNAEKEKKSTAAKDLGLEGYDINDLAYISNNIEPEILTRIIEEHKASQRERPQKESVNPERRSERVKDHAKDAPERFSEEKTRSVQTGGEAVKKEAKTYLIDQYTNDDGEMFCQICNKTLPFKLPDETYYFEAVEFLGRDKLEKRHHQNYLALCPNHGAMFKHANDDPSLIHKMFFELDGDELEIILAGESETIFFTEIHILDLKAVIEVD